ncbi:peptidase M42 family protein [Proteiniborus sp. DW1]|uniref:M42 family metallopeptidase n=1 Tax=Proteiniborus sp. DW1 TaxID=1889883 RepID=UPI00092E1889|nr:M42 family metallopeptidase [Proteiniborus sp. DW1]SCG83363.1 peptidase M42 family protein [Proteiniborus sp. DW1]
MNFNGELLKKLVNAFGPSGDEQQIAEIIKAEIKDYVDEIRTDRLGNLIARKKGNGSKVMLAAHMDQIGLLITDIDEKGFLRFTNIGGISPYVSLGQRVIFKNGNIGVIYMEPMEDISKLKLENMYIDIGARSKEEAEKIVSIGDSCVYTSQYYENDNNVISGCLDDRIGCYILIETIKELKEANNDIYFVFTSQEEVGLRGAKTSAYSIDPDFGIAIDITSSGDTPKAKRFAVGLDKGAAIKVKDQSILVSPVVKDFMVKVAKDKNIPYQLEVLERGGTDSGAIHLTKEGVPSGVISVPTRYVHSPSETISKNDVNNCISLLLNIINKKLEF